MARKKKPQAAPVRPMVSAKRHNAETGDGHVQKAKVFMTGRSQAIRLPKEFRVEVDEVYLKKTHDGFEVMTSDPWDELIDYLEKNEPPDTFLEERPARSVPQKRKWWYEE
jgi:antitoxin VapB